jgi:hypothetical protein
MPIDINPNARVKNKPLFGKLILTSARVNINNPTIPRDKATFCLFEMPKASGLAMDML